MLNDRETIQDNMLVMLKAGHNDHIEKLAFVLRKSGKCWIRYDQEEPGEMKLSCRSEENLVWLDNLRYIAVLESKLLTITDSPMRPINDKGATVLSILKTNGLDSQPWENDWKNSPNPPNLRYTNWELDYEFSNKKVGYYNLVDPL